jgi:integrase
MLKFRQRGPRRKHRLEGFIAGRRVRLSLGTRNYEAAVRLAGKVERAVVEGSESKLWPEIENLLPSSSFRRLAEIIGYTPATEAEDPTWESLRQSFEVHCRHRIARRKLRETSWVRYQHTLKEFEEFLNQRGIAVLKAVTRRAVEDFKAWRLERILARKHSKGGGGLDLDIAILHLLFAYAVEQEMVERNPVKLEGKPGARPERGAQPFSTEELGRLRKVVGEDLLIFLLLRWTGLRGSDAVTLRWKEVDWRDKGINRLTQKRLKQVWVPLHPELLFVLDVERQRRQPEADDYILLNPATGKPLTRPRLYERIRALGDRAGVIRVHPHRFRDTFAVDMLLKGLSPYDVAKILGDTIHTIETHYAPFVRELRERARRFIESEEGLEAPGTLSAHYPAPKRSVQ